MSYNGYAMGLGERLMATGIFRLVASNLSGTERFAVKSVLGGAMLSLGSLVLVLSGAYYGYGILSGYAVDRLNYSLERPDSFDVVVSQLEVELKDSVGHRGATSHGLDDLADDQSVE